VGVYGLIGFASALVGVLSSVTQYTGALRASRVLFKRLLVGVVRATMRYVLDCCFPILVILIILARWHDTTPTGDSQIRLSH
jgi:hypothetical protein